jgi:diguanylate cyclase (GGDEF)-like protein
MNSISAPDLANKIPLRCLLIEDQEDDARLLLNLLQRSGYSATWERVDTLPELERALHSDWEIIFSDHAMPGMDGMQALRVVRQHNPDVPFIFVSGTIGEDIAVEAMRTGAQDYIMKDNLTRLVPAVQRELKEAGVRRGKRIVEQRLRYLSHHDPMTSLPNRFHFLEYLSAAIDRRGSSNELLAVIYIDVDRFKTINDSLGYEAGNFLLQRIGKRLLECIGQDGIAARIAADEFALVHQSFFNRQQMRSWLQDVLDALDKPYFIQDCSLYFSVSIGVAVYPDDGSDAGELLGKADIATYRAKDEGGKGYLFFEPAMAVRLEERLTLERNMRLGLERSEFFLTYQPQLELATGRIVGMEALIRWNSSERGLISPASFIPLAEETGFILPMSEWVLHQACRQVQLWRNAQLPAVRVAVNISARQFHDDHLLEIIRNALDTYQLPPEFLEIEITESTIIRDSAKAAKIFGQIQNFGIQIALDDFGTGYSSLSYLKSFKTDYLKIDQSFIRSITENENSRTIVSAIIAMADKLSIKTIAEGVETREQFELLKALGCHMVQGYFIGRPADAESVQQMLQSTQAENKA